MYIYATCMCLLPSEARRACWSSWNWNCPLLLASDYVLGIEPRTIKMSLGLQKWTGPSVRRISPLKSRVLSPASPAMEIEFLSESGTYLFARLARKWIPEIIPFSFSIPGLQAHVTVSGFVVVLSFYLTAVNLISIPRFSCPQAGLWEKKCFSEVEPVLAAASVWS